MRRALTYSTAGCLPEASMAPSGTAGSFTVTPLKAEQINENSPWQDITPAGEIYEAGTAALVNTGEWRTMTPEFIGDKCRHCMLCVPYCPDSAIPVRDGRRLDFDFIHCKGCGICYEVCPFEAIGFGKEAK